MQARQIALIRETIAQIRPVAGVAGDCLYERLFELDPSLRPLFHTDGKAQGRKMLQTLESILAHIDSTEAFVPVAVDLGRRHREYGVSDAHYELVRRALLGMFEQFLGPDFTPEVRRAWNEAYSVIAHVMQAAAPERTDHATSSHGP